MRNALVGLGLLIVVCLAALFALPYVVDWNNFRGTFEEEVSRVVGRDVRVGGRVNLTLLPSPRFDIEKVRIADPGASTGEPFARVERIEARVAIAPLLRGILEATEINLVKPQLRLVLDGQGGGNWQSLAFNARHIPLVRDVALQSVTITAGEITVADASNVERLKISEIGGELSAPALEGPYRFRGNYKSAGLEREVRFSTTKPDAEGSIRLRGSLKLLDRALTATLDGRLTGGAQRPRFEGDLSAEIPLLRLGKAPEGSATRKPRGTASDAPPAELKSRLIITPETAELDDVTITLEQLGQPQIITGAAKASWLNDATLDVTLASRWLDLDQIIGLPASGSPVTAAFELLSDRVGTFGPGENWRSSLRVTVDQGMLGRDQINAMDVLLRSTPDRSQPTTARPQPQTTIVEAFRVGLPGGSRLELVGQLTATHGQDVRTTENPKLDDAGAAPPPFAGALTLKGASLVRLLTWANGGTANTVVAIDPASDGAFAIRMNIALGHNRVSVDDVSGELAGTSVSGAVSYDWSGPRRRLDARLDGPQVDLRPLLGTLSETRMTAPSLAALIATLSNATSLDATLELRTAQLLMRDRTFDDVDARLILQREKLRIERLRGRVARGLAFEIDGELDGALQAPRGALRGRVHATTPEGLAMARALFGVSTTLLEDPALIARLLPVDLAGTLTLHPGERRRTDLSVRGRAGALDIRFSTAIDGPLPTWRDRLVDVATVIESADTPTLLAFAANLNPAARRLAASDTQTLQQTATTTAPPTSRLSINAIGIPTEGMPSRVSLETADASVDLRGRLTPLALTTELAGDLVVRAIDGAQLTSLLPDLPRLGLDHIPVNGRARIVLTATSLTLDDLALAVGDTDIAGQLILVSEAGTNAQPIRRITARIATSKATLGGVLAPVSGARTKVSPALVKPYEWPDAPFDLTQLSGLEGTIDIDAQTLSLTPAMVLGATNIALSLEPGRLVVRTFNSTTDVGRWSGSLRLERAPLGAQLTGVLRFADGRLDAFNSKTMASTNLGTPPASGTLSGFVTLSGRAPSMSALIETLEGTGTLDVGEMRIAGMMPGAVEVTAETLLRSRDVTSPDALRQRIDEALNSGTLVARPAKYGLRIADGALRVTEAQFELPDGKISADAVVDLRSLELLSTWRLEPRRVIQPNSGAAIAWTTETRAQPWPAILVVVRGPLMTEPGPSRRLLMDEFVREFTVRKVERDVAELERLRQRDEDRVREEAERRRQLEEPALNAPAAPSPGSTPGPTIVPQNAPAPLPIPGLPPIPQPEAAKRSEIDGLNPTPASQPPPAIMARPQAPTSTEPQPPSAKSSVPAPGGYRPSSAEENKRLFGEGTR